MTIHITNSFSGSSNICSVTRKQYKASCPIEEVRDLQVALALVSSCLFSAAVGLARARTPQGQPTCVFRVAISVNKTCVECVKHLGL